MADLTINDLNVLLESLSYSTRNVRDGQAPYVIKQQNLQRLDDVKEKLQLMKRSLTDELHND